MTQYRLKRHYEAKAPTAPTKEQWDALERTAAYFERSRLNDYMNLVDKKSHWIRVNLVGGIFRGIGLAIGFSLLGAAIFIFLQQVVLLNLPVISDYLAKLLDMIEQTRSIRP